MIPAWAIASVVGLVLLLFVRGGDEEGGGLLSDFVATITGRGSRVGRATTPNDLGVIEDDPLSLARSAGVDLEIYALARMLSSEEGPSPTVYKIAVGWAAVNAAGGNVAHKLLAGKGASDGHFASQNARYETGQLDPATEDPVTEHAGKYATTAVDPREDDIVIATAILGGALADLTKGATNFYRPRVQDRQYAAGKVRRSAEQVDAEWRARGLEPLEIDGIDSAELAFYREGGSAVG